MRAMKKTLRQPSRDRRTRASFERKLVRLDFPPGATAKEIGEEIRKLHEGHRKRTTRLSTKPPGGQR